MTKLSEEQIQQRIKDQAERKEEKRQALLASFQPKNGLSVPLIKENGHQVSVVHLRPGWRIKKQVAFALKNGEMTEEDLTDVCFEYSALVPSYLRKEFIFAPNGGQTRIFIRAKNGKIVNVVGNCHDNDNFSYKLGVKYALEAVPEDMVKLLLTK